jgi:orotate phosphoribosyltransferase
MIYEKETARKVAELLLQIKAIKLQPNDPFTWASGWKSPIYCDNRISLSFPNVRTFVRQSLVKAIDAKFGTADVIAGVATGAIAQGTLVAQELGLPMVYVRPEPKKHGLQNLLRVR